MASKRHPADEPEFDAPPKANTIGNDGDILPVHQDPKTESGKTEDVKPNAGSAAVPCFEEPKPRPGQKLEGSDTSRSGAGASDPVPPPIRPDGF